MTYMLDTNICIYCIKHKPKQVLDKLFSCSPEEICISSITYAELCYGVEKSEYIERNRIALLFLLSNIKIMDFDSNASATYGEIRADLERKGTIIGPLDMLIGAHAKALGVTLVTNNEKEFRRITGLKVDNWVKTI